MKTRKPKSSKVKIGYSLKKKPQNPTPHAPFTEYLDRTKEDRSEKSKKVSMEIINIFKVG